MVSGDYSYLNLTEAFVHELIPFVLTYASDYSIFLYIKNERRYQLDVENDNALHDITNIYKGYKMYATQTVPNLIIKSNGFNCNNC